MTRHYSTMDGNEAAARVAYRLNEVIAIYPITPASPMGEWADAWAAASQPNLLGAVPDVVEMQSEGGAAGAVHGALQAGSLTTTFTASQGLLLMLPNMYKIAGELTPCVIHVAARALATHALSIFGDHSDVMSARSTGWAMLAASSVQEAQDFALVSQAATLRSRVPFLHFFDGFRTSHEVNKIEVLSDETLRSLIDWEAVSAHRGRALNPDRPQLRGTAQNPDVFFQAREAANPFYLETPEIVLAVMEEFAQATGRGYRLFEYEGAPDADRVVVLMGSGCGAAGEAVAGLAAEGQKVGVLKVRLYRPWDMARFLQALPSTVRSIAVLDRTKEPGALGEPLFLDVVASVAEGWSERYASPAPRVIGGRYGLSSKEFTPAMVRGVFRELSLAEPRRRFTVGVADDVTRLSIDYDADECREAADVKRAVFYGLGSDGTVGATKNSVKIIGENTDLHAQGYFVYDSKKAGSVTVSHLRFSPRPIEATYLIRQANFVACHQFQFLGRLDVLETIETGGTFLLNSPYGPDEVWDRLPREVQQTILDKQLKFYVVDALQVAKDAGLRGRINTVMQTCFFKLAQVLPGDEAIEQIKSSIKKTYGKRGEEIVRVNFAAVDASLDALHQVATPGQVSSDWSRVSFAVDHDDDFVKRVTARILAGQGDLLPVSALPVDGTFPTGTARIEKRSIADEIPIWDAEICIQCGLCSWVCPHAAIRMKAFPVAEAAQAPAGFAATPWKAKEPADSLMTIQVAPDDCTGCGVCVDVCPAKSKEVARHKAINMAPKHEHLEREQRNFEFFLSIPDPSKESLSADSVKTSQLLLPLFEYSGACAGCGETPYLKLLSQLFGDRALIANATGCSSIYGGNLPTTPWTVDADGRGPAWSNSLFEDNAEFGLGMRLALDQQREYAEHLAKSLAGQVGDSVVDALLGNAARDEAAIAAQRRTIAALREKLAGLDSPAARELSQLADVFVHRDVWIVGGDGWAYDIGFGGLDHLLSSGRDVNILVLDTGVYSNTGGQASKSTPRAATAKFAASGKPARRKDLGMLAVSYGAVYVAQVAMGANPNQTFRAFREAQNYRGPSLILAYSQCIAHGINMTTGMTHQKDIVRSGFWPLYRYDPGLAHDHGHPFQLDSRKPSLPFREVAAREARFAILQRTHPEHAARLLEMAQRDINDQWRYYEQLAGVERELSETATESL